MSVSFKSMPVTYNEFTILPWTFSSKHSAIILDCGEDSYGQLYRFFGKAKASRILRKVKAIFISHLHADHHLVSQCGKEKN